MQESNRSHTENTTNIVKGVSGSTEKGIGGSSYGEGWSKVLTLRSSVCLPAVQILMYKKQMLLDFSERMIILDKINMVLFCIGIKLLKLSFRRFGFSFDLFGIFIRHILVKGSNLCPKSDYPTIELIGHRIRSFLLTLLLCINELDRYTKRHTLKITSAIVHTMILWFFDFFNQNH
jgi:hypothetical protein